MLTLQTSSNGHGFIRDERPAKPSSLYYDNYSIVVRTQDSALIIREHYYYTTRAQNRSFS